MYEDQNAANVQARAGQTTVSAKPNRPLDAVGDAANRVFALANSLESFLGRFYGPSPETAGGADNSPIAIGYQSEIARLHGNLDRLTGLVENLDSIG